MEFEDRKRKVDTRADLYDYEWLTFEYYADFFDERSHPGYTRRMLRPPLYGIYSLCRYKPSVFVYTTVVFNFHRAMRPTIMSESSSPVRIRMDSFSGLDFTCRRPSISSPTLAFKHVCTIQEHRVHRTDTGLW